METDTFFFCQVLVNIKSQKAIKNKELSRVAEKLLTAVFK